MEQLYKCLSAALSKHIRSATEPLPDNVITEANKSKSQAWEGGISFVGIAWRILKDSQTLQIISNVLGYCPELYG